MDRGAWWTTVYEAAKCQTDSMSTMHDMACPECFHIFNEFNLKKTL